MAADHHGLERQHLGVAVEVSHRRRSQALPQEQAGGSRERSGGHTRGIPRAARPRSARSCTRSATSASWLVPDEADSRCERSRRPRRRCQPLDGPTQDRTERRGGPALTARLLDEESHGAGQVAEVAVVVLVRATVAHPGERVGVAHHLVQQRGRGRDRTGAQMLGGDDDGVQGIIRARPAPRLMPPERALASLPLGRDHGRGRPSRPKRGANAS